MAKTSLKGLEKGYEFCMKNATCRNGLSLLGVNFGLTNSQIQEAMDAGNSRDLNQIKNLTPEQVAWLDEQILAKKGLAPIMFGSETWGDRIYNESSNNENNNNHPLAGAGSVAVGGAPGLPPDDDDDNSNRDKNNNNNQNNTSKDPNEIKHTYNSIKDSPNYPKGFKDVQNGTVNNTVKDKPLLEQLRKIEPGRWTKVYKDGYDAAGNKVSIHYFRSQSGRVFNVKVKTGGWSNL